MEMSYWYRRVFVLAIPLILSNLTEPLGSIWGPVMLITDQRLLLAYKAERTSGPLYAAENDVGQRRFAKKGRRCTSPLCAKP